jgi:hypothetical protein
MRRFFIYALVFAGVSALGISHSGGGEGTSGPSVSGMPKEEDIFAITVWNRARTPSAVVQLDPVKDADLIKAFEEMDDSRLRNRAVVEPPVFYVGRSTTRTVTQPAGARWLAIQPQDTYWEGKYKVADNDVREMLKTYHRVTQKQWNGFSHVAGGDLGGWLILNDGRCIQWMMKPGGLAWLRFADGEMIYLSKTPPPTTAPSTSEVLSRDEQVQMVVLERMLKNWGQIQQGEEQPQINYLAISDTLHLFGGKDEPRDPSEKVVTAKGMSQVKKFSECVVKKHERMPVSDPKSGLPGRILWIGPIKWTDDQTAETSAGVWENMEFAPGEMLRIHREDGQWKITATGGWLT